MKQRQFRNLSDLKPDRRNARKHGERNLATITHSLEEYGAARSIVIDEDGVIMAGNGLVQSARALGMTRIKTVEASGKEIVAVIRRGLTAKQKAGLAVADNRTAELAEWDADILSQLSGEIDLSGMFTEEELAEIIAASAITVDLAPAGSLAERFGVPPFTVLDARQGYWQDRKAAWLALGIESELGRGGGHGTPPHPPTVTQNPDGTLNYNGTAGQAKRFDRQKQSGGASLGGSPRPACDYRAKQRGDGRGRAIV